MGALARFCGRYRFFVLGAWLVVLIISTMGVQAWGSQFKNEYRLPKSESREAAQLIANAFPAKSGISAQIVVRAKHGTVNDAEVIRRVEHLLERLRPIDGVAQIERYDTPTNRTTHISSDSRIAFMDLYFKGKDYSEIPDRSIRRVVDTARSSSDELLEVHVGGDIVSQSASTKVNSTELLAIAAAAVVLWFAFGSLLATLLPIITGVLALGLSRNIVEALSHVMSVADFTPALASLLALGVGIDYALFIVTRCRSNLHRGLSVEEAVENALCTSGRAVLFAGITVCIALLGQLVVGLSFLRGAAIGASLAVLVTLFVSLTALPPLLRIVGERVLSRKERKVLAENGPKSSEELSPKWYAWSNIIGRHPVMIGLSALMILGLMAIPATQMRLGSTDPGNDPKGSTSREAYDILSAGFGPSFQSPIEIVATTTNASAQLALTQFVDQLKSHAHVARVAGPIAGESIQQDGTSVSLVRVYTTSSPRDETTDNLIRSLRNTEVPAAEKTSGLQIRIGGLTAVFLDFADVIQQRIPQFLLAVVGLAFILLMVMFRSLLIPLLASLMNILAAAAAFGLIVAVFQWGWFADILGVARTGPIMVFLPVMLFAILFGLSMDYEVFLISRMHEEWERLQDNREAIALGQAESGRVITAAAAIMIVVFGAFAFGTSQVIKLFGLGLAGAIFVDAMIIRTMLLPAIMHVCGRANWWFPSRRQKRDNVRRTYS